MLKRIVAFFSTLVLSLTIFYSSRPFLQTLLNYTARQGETGKMLALVWLGADPNGTAEKVYSFHGDGGWIEEVSALEDAASAGQSEAVQFLIDHGAQVNAVDKRGYSALYSAASGNHLRTVQVLIANGADVNIAGESGSAPKTPLEVAAAFADTEVVQFLLNNGAGKSESLNRALVEAAASKNRIEKTKLLLSRGADVNFQQFGETALQSAENIGDTELMDLLRRAGANK